MFRARIYGQAFTVAAMIGGSYYYQDKREAEKALRIEAEGVKAKERQNAWIRELEEREREDREVSALCNTGEEEGCGRLR
jgi:hypothetical protein